MNRILIVLMFLFMGTTAAQARVFNFKNETMGAFFRGSYGLSRLGTKPFGLATSGGVVFNDEHTKSFGGEIGFLFTFSEYTTLRIGAEVIQSRMSELTGSSAAGVKWYDLVSDVFIFNPEAALEFHVIRSDAYRLSVFGGIGYSQVTMDLTYAFTAAGQTQYGGVADYVEKSEALILSGHYGVMFEFLLADTTTMALEAGFRQLQVPKMEHKHDLITTEGSVTKGSRVTNYDGGNRNFDMGGFYAALNFRFWIDVL